ncbi:MAG: GNAT family N-acetyltransferase [Oscillibacter sp.]|nr:GNAT family N-acetyltransferase [Oscillibacter sp.]
MEIRKATLEDLNEMMEIYAFAREFMAAHGNPTQWGRTWPPEALIRADIAQGRSYVCVSGGSPVGTFYFAQGERVEPTYARIEDGAWRSDAPYGVIHRLAANGKERGVGAACITWALAQSRGHLRIDTHGDNRPMQALLKKLGFTHCGTIYVEEDDAPRLAYERIAGDGE